MGCCDTASNGAQITAGLYRLLIQLSDTVVSRQNSQERKCCHFLRRYQKTKKNKDFRVLAKARPEESKIFGFFGFFGTPPGKCKLLVENVAIS